MRLTTLGPILVCLAVLALTPARADAQQTSTAPARSGRDLYLAACATCHGADGRGASPTSVGFDTPLPDFTDCRFTSPEADADWAATIHKGAKGRAFSRHMPAFGDALSEADIARVIGHLRTFCTDHAWPRGELNLPRPLVTEKAFPENEAVASTSFSRAGGSALGTDFIYEHRLGRRAMYEVAVPLEVQQGEAGGWARGLGDIAAAVKYTVAHSLERGHILSVGGEMKFPTGKETRGLGTGVTVVEPFLAVGQMIGADGFVQIHSGIELSTNRAALGHEAYVRTAVGRSVFEERGLGRMWAPMLELVGARELTTGESMQWDLVPEMQVTLSRRHHVRINAGLQFPVNEREGRGKTFMTYLLWDWFDGGLLDGWR